MWIFLSGGMLMPALIPESVLRAAKTPDIAEAVERGWELQVRGRVREHLDWFAETYMTPGTYSSTYVVNDKDYQARFYTTREDFADAMAAASLAMDYTKFKDTSKAFPWGKKYHDLLLRVWSASANIFGAGGFYGPRSKDNPRGYGKARSAKRGRQRDYVGSTFFEDEVQDYADDRPVRRSRSIHEMSDAELAAMDDDEFADLAGAELEDLTDDELLAMWGREF